MEILKTPSDLKKKTFFVIRPLNSDTDQVGMVHSNVNQLWCADFTDINML